MQRVIGFVILLLLASQSAHATQPPVTFTFGGSSGRVSLRAGGWLDAERFWFVAQAEGAVNLPYTGSPCPASSASAQSNCAIWGVIDVRLGELTSLHAQQDLVAIQAAMVGDRLFISGNANRIDLPQVQGTAMPATGPNAGYLLSTNPAGSAEFGSYLPAEFRPHALMQVAGDIVIAGNAPCVQCSPSATSSERIRLLRLNSTLTTLHYDRVLPGSWSILGHAVDDTGRIHFAVTGRELPTSDQSAIADHPPPVAGYAGGLVGVDAANGELAYATYLGVPRPFRVVWDAARQGVWVLSTTSDANFPLTVDAADTTFCEPGTCAIVQCGPIITGYSCNYPSEAALQRIQADGRRIDYASFVGGPASDKGSALYLGEDGRVSVLTIASRMGAVMSGGDNGPRDLTVIDPEARSASPSLRRTDLALTAAAGLLAKHPSYGDLFARNHTDSALPGSAPVVRLTPDNCPDTPGQTVRCVSVIWVEHFGSSTFSEARQIPGPRAAMLALLAALLALIGLALRHRA